MALHVCMVLFFSVSAAVTVSAVSNKSLVKLAERALSLFVCLIFLTGATASYSTGSGRG